MKTTKVSPTLCRATCLCWNQFDIQHDWLKKCKTVACDNCRKPTQ